MPLLGMNTMPRTGSKKTSKLLMEMVPPLKCLQMPVINKAHHNTLYLPSPPLNVSAS